VRARTLHVSFTAAGRRDDDEHGDRRGDAGGRDRDKAAGMSYIPPIGEMMPE
jgi:hypothetical protein